METFNLPKYSKVIYRLNPETKYFIQTEIEAQETPINRLPLEMRLAPAGAANVKINAAKVLLSKEHNKGKYQFITGLQPTVFENWYLGNDYEYYRGVKVLSIVLFHFTSNETEIEVYYFHRYDKKNTFYRLHFVNAIIPEIKEIGAC
jgi:hypothetical protein